MTQRDSVDIRIMTKADITHGVRLSGTAGWNQTEQDWRRFLDLQPKGCFVATRDGTVVGTVTTLSYEKKFGWIGMMLVDSAARKLGIGTRLLKKGMEHLRSENVETLKLDATVVGRNLYLRLGFLEEYEIERWEVASASANAAPDLPLMSETDLARVLDCDREVFGADRSPLLRRLWEENPRCTAVVCRGARLIGYMLGRSGHRAHYLGPWIAHDAAAARSLLQEFLARFRGAPVFVDACLRNPSSRELVERAGFELQRRLTRMYCGPNRHSGQPEKVFGIGGPETG